MSNLLFDVRRRSIGLPDRVRSNFLGRVDVVQRLGLEARLCVHRGCVNSLCWSERGDLLLSASDDTNLVLTNTFRRKVVVSVPSGHRANIFSARFLPGACEERLVVSCAGDGAVAHTDLERPQQCGRFTCHRGTAYEVVVVPGDPNSFLSCGEDGTVRWFDLRTRTQCSRQDCTEDVLISGRSAVCAMALDPVVPFRLALGSADSAVRVYDRRMLTTSSSGGPTCRSTSPALLLRFSPSPLGSRPHRVTSLSYSADGARLLVSYSADSVYLFSPLGDSGGGGGVGGGGAGVELKKTGGGAGAGGGGELRRQVYADLPTRPREPRPLPVKRLRLRGDWSDTGPRARPESERETTGDTGVSLMQRMSEMLSRWFEEASEGDTAGSRPPRSRAASVEAAVSPSRPRGGRHGDAGRHGALASPPVSSSSSPASPLPSPDGARPVSVETPVAETAAQTETRTHSDSPPTAVRKQLDSMCLHDDAGPSQSPEGGVSGGVSVGAASRGAESGAGLAEPVLNLHYSTEGTTQSTIQLAFTSEWSQQSSFGLGRRSDPETISAGSSSAPASSSASSSSAPASSSSGAAASSSVVDDDDDESGEDEATPGHNRYRRIGNRHFSVNDVIRRSAAARIQEVFRRRKERKELEELETRCVGRPRCLNIYKGHRNSRTMIKEAVFWGDRFVLSGSDCGHIFVWERDSAQLLMLLEADNHVVNCLQPHPHEPLLASSGIDYDIKLWAPIHGETQFDQKLASEVMQRNELMLEETRNTITVPASFMLRMLASLNHIRTDRNEGERSGDSEREEDEDE